MIDYNTFSQAIGSDDIFKLGIVFGCVLGFLLYLLMTGIVSYIFDFICRYKDKKEVK